MTNKIFLKKQRKISRFFKSYRSQFLKIMTFSPSLQPFYKVLLFSIGKNILKFSNNLIYFCSLEHEINLKNDVNFKGRYLYLLRGIVLTTLAIDDNNQTNIFNYEYEIKTNKYQQNYYTQSINSQYIKKMNCASNQLYSYICELYELLNIKLEFKEFYYLMINVVLLFVVKESMFTYKSFFKLKIKTKKVAYSEEKTLLYLELFKHIRNHLQIMFPQFFNDLIFVINSQ